METLRVGCQLPGNPTGYRQPADDPGHETDVAAALDADQRQTTPEQECEQCRAEPSRPDAEPDGEKVEGGEHAMMFAGRSVNRPVGDSLGFAGRAEGYWRT
jgi:hypothetical protein